ncbi:hypothetical protein VTO73DRAFT_6241 [Trametes versicolor]
MYVIPFTALAEKLGDTVSDIYWPCLMDNPGVCWWAYGSFITGTLDEPRCEEQNFANPEMFRWVRDGRATDPVPPAYTVDTPYAATKTAFAVPRLAAPFDCSPCCFEMGAMRLLGPSQLPKRFLVYSSRSTLFTGPSQKVGSAASLVTGPVPASGDVINAATLAIRSVDPNKDSNIDSGPTASAPGVACFGTGWDGFLRLDKSDSYLTNRDPKGLIH